MTATTPIRWGILGPGSIAKAFAGGVAGSRTGKLVAIGTRNPGKPGLAETFPRRPHPRRLRGAARRPGGRRGLYRDAASRPCRMGDQGGGSRQARAVRKAAGADRLRGRRDDPCGAQGRHLSRRSLHVPAASADAEAGRAGQVRRHRRGPDDQVELRLRHAGLHAGAPALRQRPRRRRHSRRRRLSGLDGAADCRRGGGQALRSSRTRWSGVAHLGQSGVDEWASARAAVSQRHRRRGLLRISLNQDNVLRILGTQGPHRGAGLLVRRRQPRWRAWARST